MYNSVGFGMLRVVQPPTLSNKEIFITPKENPIPVISHSTPPQSLAASNPLSVSIDLAILDISYRWNYTACDLCFLSLSMLSRFSQVVACINAAFLFIAKQYPIVWIYRI